MPNKFLQNTRNREIEQNNYSIHSEFLATLAPEARSQNTSKMKIMNRARFDKAPANRREPDPSRMQRQALETLREKGP